MTQKEQQIATLTESLTVLDLQLTALDSSRAANVAAATLNYNTQRNQVLVRKQATNDQIAKLTAETEPKAQ